MKLDFLSFFKQYATKPRTVGAILPSSKYLARKMMAPVDFAHARYIVEYGPGTGVFTEQLLANRQKGTTLIVFESNAEFYHLLKQKYPHEADFHLIHDSAENLEQHLTSLNIPRIDYIVSGLPFASLPQQVSFEILRLTQKHLQQGGTFITFQYTLLKKDLIGNYFSKIEIEKELRNVPPAYAFSCRV